ncbi:MAG: hypothetical protein GMKNLPBB_03366 [Myxococcota bacterium]|nr:hypothetical protein [Myxococcota bacterium]
MRYPALSIILSLLTLTACGGSSSSGDAAALADSGGGKDSGDMMKDSGGMKDAGGMDKDASPPPPGDGGATGGDGGGPGPTDVIPGEAGALWAFLTAKKYMNFKAEPEVHPSGGPHGKVRTWFNAILAGSLEKNMSAHPRGAGAVKELYAADGTTLTGWAVELKVQDDSAGGKGWYWYEVLSTTDDSKLVADGLGVQLCAGCHGRGGVDYVLTPLPK